LESWMLSSQLLSPKMILKFAVSFITIIVVMPTGYHRGYMIWPIQIWCPVRRDSEEPYLQLVFMEQVFAQILFASLYFVTHRTKSCLCFLATRCPIGTLKLFGVVIPLVLEAVAVWLALGFDSNRDLLWYLYLRNISSNCITLPFMSPSDHLAFEPLASSNFDVYLRFTPCMWALSWSVLFYFVWITLYSESILCHVVACNNVDLKVQFSVFRIKSDR
jgi:hypothetical protein